MGKIPLGRYAIKSHFLVVNFLHLECNCRLLEGFLSVFKGVVNRHPKRAHTLDPVDVFDYLSLELVSLHLVLHLLLDRRRYVERLPLRVSPRIRFLKDGVLHEPLSELLILIVLLVVGQDVLEIVF